MSGETTRQEVGAQSPLRQNAEKIAEKNGGTLGLSREQAAAELAKRGVYPPDQNQDAAQERALAHTREILARPDLDPAYRAMLEKSVATVTAKWQARGKP